MRETFKVFEPLLNWNWKRRDFDRAFGEKWDLAWSQYSPGSRLEFSQVNDGSAFASKGESVSPTSPIRKSDKVASEVESN